MLIIIYKLPIYFIVQRYKKKLDKRNNFQFIQLNLIKFNKFLICANNECEHLLACVECETSLINIMI